MMHPYYDKHPRYNTMTLSGDGQVTTVPDTARIRLGVETTGELLSDIQQENAELSQTVIQSLRQLGVSDIKTYQYTINKRYDYVDGNQIDRGYIVRNILEIQTEALEQIGLLIDTAVNNGANVVDLISFDVSDIDGYYKQALNLAVIDAMNKAKSLSSLLGLPMLPSPVHITENSITPIPFADTAFRRERSFVTPVEPGSQTVKASVTVDFFY